MAKRLENSRKSVVNFEAPYRILEDGNVENVMQDNFLRYSMSDCCPCSARHSGWFKASSPTNFALHERE